MPSVRAMVILPMDSAIPRDVAINNWHATMGDIGTGCTAMALALGAFYQGIRTLLSAHIDHANIRAKFYNWDEPEPRAPVSESLLGVTGPLGSGTVPHELAVCLSFQGDRQAGRVQSRRRGRVYIGPLQSAIATFDGLVDVTLRDTLNTAAGTFLTASAESSAWTWVVHSTRNAASPDTPVTNGWVDNAFDIQRRRGTDATSRATFGVAG